MQEVFVCGSQRTPFVKSMGQYFDLKTSDLLELSLKALVQKYGLEGKTLGDVGSGAVMMNSSDWNLTREAVLGSGLHANTPGFNLQRACGTGLEIANVIALKIKNSQIQSGIASGVDTNSDLPILFQRSFARKLFQVRGAKSTGQKLEALMKFTMKDLKPAFPAVVEPRTGLSMGQHCELMVKQFKISREEQDRIAFNSHQNAAKGYESGFYSDLVFDVKGIKQDGLVRKDTSLEKLAKLKPVFDPTVTGTLTAGNSSPLTDGSAAVLMASAKGAKDLNVQPLARFVDCEVAALNFVAGEGLLMAPTMAVSQLLERNKLTLQDFDFYEIHEAFAGQVACTLKAWEDAEFCKSRLGRSAPLGPIDQSKMNIYGGSVALGHPFGATGARIVGTLAKILSQKKGRGLISICTGGGMGVAAIMESI